MNVNTSLFMVISILIVIEQLPKGKVSSKQIFCQACNNSLINHTGLTAFEPQLGHAFSLCSLPQFIHENFNGWYAAPLIPVPQRGPDLEDDMDLCQPLIPPKPAFLKVMSFL